MKTKCVFFNQGVGGIEYSRLCARRQRRTEGFGPFVSFSIGRKSGPLGTSVFLDREQCDQLRKVFDEVFKEEEVKPKTKWHCD